MFVIRGGMPLRGRVAVSGAKNAALPIMAAALIARGPTVLRGVPDLVDVDTLASLLQTLGVQVERSEDGALSLEARDESPFVAHYELVRRMRASVCVLGPLLARRKRACVSLPGGCNIGDRPIDLHLKGLAALGAEIRVERGYVLAEADRLRGANIYLGGPFGSTVTGTCNVMAAAALALGRTTIEAAACEPEVVDFGRYLNRMGACIRGLGTPFVVIEGVDELHGAEHEIIPDRIEAATLMIAAAITRGDVEIENVEIGHMTAVLEKLREIGASLEMHDRSVRVRVPGTLAPTDCIALPYPGIPTDVQAQLMALLTRTAGISVVTDKVFPDRFMHLPELVRLGARIRREGSCAIVNGVPSLSGACVMASDLRASAALVLAALAADGESVVRRIYHLDRGYDRLEHKLNHLGANIQRVPDDAAHLPASLECTIAEPPRETTGGHELRGPTWLRHPRRASAE
ncbi:MAG TPA: UDP-N-acetylglucosamine 1-carboxyvinyltransferase [Planctomycetaceae bacterium]|nr:UDP-N-acetylglucosamine 1-carboxyvinyltransferase [Planctomycetaceae bacterium]